MSSLRDETNEDLRATIEKGLLGDAPCWCGTPDEGSCPACGVGLAGLDALKELMRRLDTNE